MTHMKGSEWVAAFAQLRKCFSSAILRQGCASALVCGEGYVSAAQE